MLNQFLRRLAAALVGSAIAAAAAAIAAVAGAFALYGVLKLWVSPAGAAALDGLAFALLAGILALCLPALVRRRRPRADRDGIPESNAAKLATDALVALITVGLEMARGRRSQPKEARTKAERGRRKRRAAGRADAPPSSPRGRG